MQALQILADENIPHVREAFGHVGSVRVLPGRAITRAAATDADILLVRSITRVHSGLVEGTRIQFVGSATIGTDHIDQQALRARGIAFAHARGAGAESVAEYVTTALIVIASQTESALSSQVLGIVGCGDIGRRVLRRARALGMRVLQNDPPLAAASLGAHPYVPLRTLLGESDIVTLHVPLLRQGPHATHHLIGQKTLGQMKRSAWLINTSRGPVVNSRALGEALKHRALNGAVLDVWENEPTPSLRLIRAATVATPHVAGHSYDGKLLGTVLLYQAVTRRFGLQPLWDYAALATPAGTLALAPPTHARSAAAWLDGLARQMYDLRADDARTRALMTAPRQVLGARFSALRTTYPKRRAFRWYQIAADLVPASLQHSVAHGLGVRLGS